MRSVGLAAAVAIWLAGAARAAGADGADVAARGEAASAEPDSEDHAAVQLAVGAGSDDGATALAELRASWHGGGRAIELGARVRWQHGVVVEADWDGADDWLGLVRKLEVTHRGASVAAALGAGRLAPFGYGGVVADYTTAAALDRRAPGVIGSLRAPGLAIDAMIDDVTAPTLVAGAVGVAIAGRWRATIGVAIDPGTAVAGALAAGVAGAPAARAGGAVELGAGWGAGPVVIGGGVIASPRGDLAAVARGDAAVHRGGLRASAQLEARAFTGAAVAAPFGPLSPVERERMAVGGGWGFATSISAAVAVAGVGELSAGVRSRGARGDLVTARVTLPWWRAVQAGGYAAVGVDAAIAAGEARIRWTSRWFSAVEAGRGYRRDEAGALGAVWQAAAWFGAAAGW